MISTQIEIDAYNEIDLSTCLKYIYMSSMFTNPKRRSILKNIWFPCKSSVVKLQGQLKFKPISWYP